MAEKFGDYVTDVKLNRYDLAGEAERSSEALMYYHQELSEVREIRDRCENRLKLVRAEAFISISKEKDPKEKFGLDKLTVDTIKALVEIDDQVLAAEDALVEAKKEVTVYEGAVKALSNKASMIQEEIKLWAAGYFAQKA